MSTILGIPIAYGRLSKTTGDHYRFVPRAGDTAYRVIVEGVDGPFGAGFTSFVVCKQYAGWMAHWFGDVSPVGTATFYRTRDLAAAHAIRWDDANGGNVRALVEGVSA